MNQHTKQRIGNSIRNLKSLVYNLAYFAKRSQEENDLAMLRNLVLSLPREVKERYADVHAGGQALERPLPMGPRAWREGVGGAAISRFS